ncbi:hypothetical protein D9M69_552080 [compost metagenome]
MVKSYAKHSRKRLHTDMLAQRTQLDHARYADWFYGDKQSDAETYQTPRISKASYRFAGTEGYRRLYEKNTQQALSVA